jgi:hypothetical protein
MSDAIGRGWTRRMRRAAKINSDRDAKARRFQIERGWETAEVTMSYLMGAILAEKLQWWRS